MCPKPMKLPPTPTRESEGERRARTTLDMARKTKLRSSAGRSGTIGTSALGDISFGENVGFTTLGSGGENRADR